MSDMNSDAKWAGFVKVTPPVRRGGGSSDVVRSPGGGEVMGPVPVVIDPVYPE